MDAADPMPPDPSNPASPSLLILCHHPEDKAGPLMATLRHVFLGDAAACAGSGRRDVEYVGLRERGAARRAVRRLREMPNPLILFNGVFSLLTPAGVFLLAWNARVRKCRQVVYWHEGAVDLRKAMGCDEGGLGRRLWRRCAFSLVRHLLVNERTRHLTTARYNKQLVMLLLGVAPDRVYIAGNAMSLKACLLRDRAAAGDAIGLCMAGDPTWRKGFDLFCSMSKQFDRRGGRALRYTWFGGSPEWLARLPGTEAVALPGFRSDLPGELAAQDVFVQTSRDEPFGLAALEALGCDLPVFCFDSTAMAEILAPEFVCADLRDMIDKVQAYLDKPARYEPGHFRRIALGFNKERFLKAWRLMERDFGFETGLPAYKRGSE